MAVNEYKLPDVGEGLTEAEIVTWKVEVGDTIKVNDVVVEIETAKSLVELPSPYAGVVTALLAEEGATVPVGAPIIAVEDGAAATPEPAAPGGGRAADIDLSNPAATGGGENQTLVGYGPRSGSAMRRARRGPATAATMAGSATQLQVQGSFTLGQADTSEVVPADEEPVPATPARPAPSEDTSGAAAGDAPESTAGDTAHVAGDAADGVGPDAVSSRSVGPVPAKPPVRKLAKELGVDLRTLTPTGAAGRVTAEDVETAAGRGLADGDELVPETGLSDRREPVKGVRKAMAQAMVGSAFSIPHVTEWVTVDVTRTTKLLAALRRDPEVGGVRLSPLAVVARAVCLAMKRTPEVNAHWDDGTQEVVFKGAVNLGIAAATPRGLVVPNIKGADALTLFEIGRELAALAATAREGRTSPADMTGGTFTITNVGVFGVDAGTPIINPGESAILALGAIRQQPWVHRGKVRPRQVTTLSLSFDHRFIDGAKGSRFLADVAAILHDPAFALRF